MDNGRREGPQSGEWHDEQHLKPDKAVQALLAVSLLALRNSVVLMSVLW